MQLFLLRRAVPLSVVHVLPRELHRPVLILTRGIIRESIRARLELLHRRNKITGAAASFRMVCVEAEVRQDCAVGALGDLQRDAVTLAEPALLPRTEDVEEAAHANDYAYGHRAPGPVVGGARLDSHGLPGWIQGRVRRLLRERQLRWRLQKSEALAGGFSGCGFV